jgi:indolepyruvate ferredoxin oxidoreductase alpha subunit
MTGFQPHPGAPANGEPGIKIEDVVRACGVKFVEVVNCFDLKGTTEAVERAIRYTEGPSVIIARGMCAILSARNKRQAGIKAVTYTVNKETCTKCKLCINSLGCPAIIIESGNIVIDAAQCDGCGLCAQVCPTKSIVQGGAK